ncbi:MAG: thioredoxin domain-containing protein [Acidobacteriota bacterium]|nr:thioredoxin domain-containing protein [Acidobacteriota bacterium]MDH3529216.1 thioredoxin domain-containing protein [Acidobacteriota bacterium]
MQKPQKFINRLADETSPYLLQHAHNPVDWYPWGEEAFEKARADDKPVLLSIGYSACHWCHVMAHESFEDERIAKIMNEHFVNIKVDMEERPDVDKIYMNFVQLTTGSGGWPLTAFLTPDQRPFFGGTYFPPQPRFNMPSFEQILESVSEAYRERRDDILRSANEIVGEIRRIGLAEASTEPVSEELLDLAFRSFIKTFDAVNGGFGGAPKFPAPMSLEFLLRFHKRTGNEKALQMVTETCNKMAHGGIFDQIGGGFHRYTVDAIWLTPHFEKMLYDNAQLARVYLHLYQVSGDAFYKSIVERTLDYVIREMLDESGGFYSAQDADSEGVEGKFFVWTPQDVSQILETEEARIFSFFYDISEAGNFEGKNILNVKSTIAETAEAFELSTEAVTEILESAREKIFEAREKRIKPFRDEKVLTAWNGLMLAAFAEASAVLGNDKYRQVAIKNADFLIRDLSREGKLLRTWKAGKAKLGAYLEDYANLADGLFELFQVTGEVKYLRESKRLAAAMIEEFWDEEAGGFFFTSKGHEELLIRSKDFNDNATPSGNSAAFDVLLKLSKIYGEESLSRYAVNGLRIVASQMYRYPGAFGRALSAIEFHLGRVREIVVVGEPGNELEKTLAGTFLPDAVVYLRSDDSRDETPLTAGKEMVGNQATAYVCENFTCRQPVTSVAELEALIK